MCVCSIQVMSSAGIPTCQLSLSTANGTGHPFNSPYRTLFWVVLPDVLFHNCQNSSAIIDECWKHLFLKESYIPNNASTSYWKLANTPEWFIYYNLLVLCHMVLKQMKRKIFQVRVIVKNLLSVIMFETLKSILGRSVIGKFYCLPCLCKNVGKELLVRVCNFLYMCCAPEYSIFGCNRPWGRW